MRYVFCERPLPPKSQQPPSHLNRQLFCFFSFVVIFVFNGGLLSFKMNKYITFRKGPTAREENDGIYRFGWKTCRERYNYILISSCSS
ncbi:hypothetical protein OUZ56_029222 [Daphnia magna]|uniref:Uncharacterized protein n=1 Tax=Daphnia magna TaxID=35525 RepID=A0ABR0B664_9CRUS|nr:hypothetical protein OUZ56_029222 [Daphnia magna]